MTEQILEILNKILIFDLIIIVLIILSLIKCTSKGFVFSLLSASKWLLAYVLTLFLFPKTKPFVDETIDNEYILDIALTSVNLQDCLKNHFSDESMNEENDNQYFDDKEKCHKFRCIKSND